MSEPRIDLPQISDNQREYFWFQVSKIAGLGPNGNCWIWAGNVSPDGYGKVSIRTGNKTRRFYRAHKLSFYFATNKWSDLQVLHSCDNPVCVNPDHLREGTTKENAEDAKQRGRRLYGEKSATAKFTKEIVLAMRALKGTKPHSHICREFGVSETHGRRILNNETWTHI